MLLGACSSSSSSPTTTSSPVALGSVDISGTWDSATTQITATGVRSAEKSSYTFTNVKDGVFQWSLQGTGSDGKPFKVDGLGSIAPDGRMLTSADGDSTVGTGYVQDQDTIIIQVIALPSGASGSASQYATMQTLTRTP